MSTAPGAVIIDPADRAWTSRYCAEKATKAANASRKLGRRRLVDPVTTEREYTPAEMEFMFAMEAYKQKSRRMFPTWSEALQVLRELGYERVARDRNEKID